MPIPSTPAIPLPPWDRRILGRETREWVVRDVDCVALHAHGMQEITHIRAGNMFRGVRRKSPLVMVIISEHSSGQLVSEDRPWDLQAGTALLLPAGVDHDLRAGAEGWHFSLLNYYPGRWNGHALRSPRVLRVHAQPVEALIEAFYREYHGDRDTVFLRQITDILHAKILRLANPEHNARRLQPVWEAVLQTPGDPWDLDQLAALSHMSTEHLRRVCRSETGRSPMGQVAWLRLREAARILCTRHDLISEVSLMVGYESERAFRSAFEKTYSCSPTAYRQRAQSAFTVLNTGTPPAKPLNVKASRKYKESTATTRWHPVPLQKFCNARFSLGPAPWFGQDPLLGLHPGPRSIHGVPFHILDENVSPSFILMKSEKAALGEAGRKLPCKLRIPIGRKFRTAFILHACGWAERGESFAGYRWVSSTGESHEVGLHSLSSASPEESDGLAANIQDWYFGYEHFSREHARHFLLPTSKDPSASAQYLYSMRWINPHPSRKVDFLEIESMPHRNTTLAVLALTLAL